VDYSIVGQKSFPEMSADDFISMMSSPSFVGDPLIRTQHLIGAANYEWISETEISATHQVRAAHQRYSDAELTTVSGRGHGHGNAKHWYKKIGGTWKLAGVRPEMYWVEHDLATVFSEESPKK
jgi:scytalone dehydratase